MAARGTWWSTPRTPSASSPAFACRPAPSRWARTRHWRCDVQAEALAPLIERLARARGIGDAYHSYKGELKHFTLETKSAILRAMHCRLDDAQVLDQQIRESEAAHPDGLLGDVVVLRNGARAKCAPGTCPSAARLKAANAGSCCAISRCPGTCRRAITA